MARPEALGRLVSASGLRIGILLVGLVTNVVVSRMLGPDGRGEYQLVLSLAATLAAVGALSGELGLSQRFGKSDNDKDVTIATGMWGALLVALAVGGGVLLAAYVILDSEHQHYAFILSVATALAVMDTWNQRTLFLLGRPIAAALCSATAVSLALAVVVAVAVSPRLLTPELALVAYVTGLAVGTVGTLLAVRPQVGAFAVGALRDLLSLGLRYHPGQVALGLLMRVDVLLLGALGTLASVGQYSVAVALTSPLVVVGTTVSTTFLERQYSSAVGDDAVEALRLARLTSAVVLPLCVAIGVVAPLMVPLVWGEAFRGSVPLLWILLVGVLAMSAQRPFGNYFVRRGHSRATNVRAILGATTACVLCGLLIPVLGGVGAAIASSISYLVYAVTSLVFFAQREQQSWSGLLAALVRGPERAGFTGQVEGSS